ncbi:DUF3515 family protein [Actinomycetota bacterium Odt1-20B]
MPPAPAPSTPPPPSRAARRRRIALGAAVVALAAAAAIAYEYAASPARDLKAAPRAHSAACARLAAAFPDRLADADRDSTDVAGAAVWGDGAVTVRCGLPTPLPTGDPCSEVDGVDWVWRARQDEPDSRLLITYGRSPAVEVRVDTRHAAPDAVLIDLSRLVKPIRQVRECL